MGRHSTHKQSLQEQIQRRIVDPRLKKMYDRVTINMNLFREAMNLVELTGCKPVIQQHWITLRDSKVPLDNLSGRIERIDDQDDDSGSRSDTSTDDDEEIEPQVGLHIEIKYIKKAMNYVRETPLLSKGTDLGKVWSSFQRAEIFRSIIVLPVPVPV